MCVDKHLIAPRRLLIRCHPRPAVAPIIVTDMYKDMRTGMCTDMCADMRTDMCTDMCLRCASSFASEHSLTSGISVPSSVLTYQ